MTDARGGLPLLAPMSEVAGRMAVQVGAHCLEKEQGGAGVLLGGVPGVASRPGGDPRRRGGRHQCRDAWRWASARTVTVMDKSLPRLARLESEFHTSLHTLFSTTDAIEGTRWPRPIWWSARCWCPAPRRRNWSRATWCAGMRQGSVMVDIAIDQGGCFETSRPTTHADPTYVEEGVVHYCVTNMPGAVARTSTFALGNATLPFVLALADKGWRQALRDDLHLRHGLNIHAGQVTYQAVAIDLGLEFHPAERVLNG